MPVHPPLLLPKPPPELFRRIDSLGPRAMLRRRLSPRMHQVRNHSPLLKDQLPMPPRCPAMVLLQQFRNNRTSPPAEPAAPPSTAPGPMHPAPPSSPVARPPLPAAQPKPPPAPHPSNLYSETSLRTPPRPLPARPAGTEDSRRTLITGPESTSRAQPPQSPCIPPTPEVASKARSMSPGGELSARVDVEPPDPVLTPLRFLAMIRSWRVHGIEKPPFRVKETNSQAVGRPPAAMSACSKAPTHADHQYYARGQ